MRKVLLAMSLLGALVAVALAGSAIAAGSNDNPGTGAPRAIGGASAPNARIAAFVQAGGAVVRSKGIVSVTHPSTGLYCLDPKSDTLDVNKIVPSLSVDWSTSLGDALMAQWRSAGVGCSAGWIAALTFDGEDGTFDLSDGVSFTIVVPSRHDSNHGRLLGGPRVDGLGPHNIRGAPWQAVVSFPPCLMSRHRVPRPKVLLVMGGRPTRTTVCNMFLNRVSEVRFLPGAQSPPGLV